jgi:pimeloyl-ACP methyl ester carboxylesterase
MPAEGSATPANRDGAGLDDADRFAFGADPVRERWWGRPLAETRGWLEFGRLLVDPDRALDRVERSVDGLWRSHGRRVALIGHSRGGHYARALAARRPDRVSHAISMGADLRGLLGACSPTLFAVGVARRVLHATGRSGRDMCLTGQCGCRFSNDYARPFPFEQVRLTSIYSKGEAVDWQCQVIPHADCIEVTDSHVDLILNRKGLPGARWGLGASRTARGDYLATTSKVRVIAARRLNSITQTG